MKALFVKSKERRLSNLLVIKLLLGALIFLQCGPISGLILNNLAWLILADALQESQYLLEKSAVIHGLYKCALHLDTADRRAKWGQGLLNALMRDEDAAISSWTQTSTDPAIMLAYGDTYRERGDWDQALLFYRGVIAVCNSSTNEVKRQAMISAGNVCQLAMYARLNPLDKSDYGYCYDYFHSSAGNLIVNGKFDDGISGWSKRRWSGFTGKYDSDAANGLSAPSARVSGNQHQEIGGLSQQLILPADSVLIFSACVRMQDSSIDTSIRLLHVTWQWPDGRPGGSHLATISSDLEWTCFERGIRVPTEATSALTFSPALLVGEGTVLVDNVRLEFANERQMGSLLQERDN